MNKIIGIIFTILYTALAYFLALLMSVHGSEFIFQFSIGFLIIAIVVLWWIYFFVKRRNFRRNTLIFFFCALGIGLLLAGTIIASWTPLVGLDVYRSEKHALNTGVSNMRDEFLFSPKGNPVGIRLKYSMRFPDSNYFWEFPSMSSEKYLNVSSWSDMRIANQNIEPSMIGTNPLKYEQGKTYNFTVDMIPYFVIQNADKTKECIMKPPKEYTDAFQKLVQSGEQVHFNIIVSGTQFTGITTNAYNLKEFYDSAIKEGAFECKENQTIFF